MPIIVNVDVMLAKRKMSSGELAEKVGITPANLSILKTNKAKAIRFSTLEKICEVLDCKPGDILDYEKEFCLPHFQPYEYICLLHNHLLQAYLHILLTSFSFHHHFLK